MPGEIKSRVSGSADLFPSDSTKLEAGASVFRKGESEFAIVWRAQPVHADRQIDMAYIPKDARWFLAELVEEIQVEGSKRNVVHINSTLIEANTPEMAHRKAMALGKVSNSSHRNLHGKKVVTRFLGLRHLDVIHFSLEHGCEISFVEKMGVTPEGLRKLVRKKEELEAFLPIRKRPGRPDYASGDIMREVFKKLAEEAQDGAKTDPSAKRARRRKRGKRKQS